MDDVDFEDYNLKNACDYLFQACQNNVEPPDLDVVAVLFGVSCFDLECHFQAMIVLSFASSRNA